MPVPTRRLIPTIPMGPATRGAYACKWKGWMPAFSPGQQDRIIDLGLRRWNRTSIRNVERVDEVCGVYAFLNRLGHVLYIGKSTNVPKEIVTKWTGWPRFKQEYGCYITAQQAASSSESLRMELAAIKFYVPPWNKRHY